MSLAGLKVVEFAGLAPGPFAGLILADNGASVIRIDQPSSTLPDILCRGKRSLAINSKIPSGREALKRLIAQADILIDPLRPGVLERLGLGPEVFLGSGSNKNVDGLNKRLIYARLVGFPRNGPHMNMAGHDINYLALSGVLSLLPGAEGKPSFPLNLLADFAGGGIMCALGILLALCERGASGYGQVVEVDMVSGTRYLASFSLLHSLRPSSQLFTGSKILAGGAPFYNVYVCKDGGCVSVGCLEPQFFKIFVECFVREVEVAGKLPEWVPTPAMQMNIAQWPRMKQYFENGFLTRDRDYWSQVFHGTDACVVSVLTPTEATVLNASKSPLPIPHPNLTRTPPISLHTLSQSALPAQRSLHLTPGQHTDIVLRELGISEEERDKLIKDGAIEKKAMAKL